MKQLQGDELLQRLEIAAEIYPKSTLSQAYACGYESDELPEFYDALLLAKGVIKSVSSCTTCGDKKRIDAFGLPF